MIFVSLLYKDYCTCFVVAISLGFFSLFCWPYLLKQLLKETRRDSVIEEQRCGLAVWWMEEGWFTMALLVVVVFPLLTPLEEERAHNNVLLLTTLLPSDQFVYMSPLKDLEFHKLRSWSAKP
jgi:hypothetical protein